MELKQLRLKNGKTQAEVAKFLGITQASYANYELGKTEPDIKSLKKLANYYHTTIDYIVGHEVPYLINKSILSNVQLELFEKIQSLGDEDCKILSAYLDGMKSKKD